MISWIVKKKMWNYIVLILSHCNVLSIEMKKVHAETFLLQTSNMLVQG